MGDRRSGLGVEGGAFLFNMMVTYFLGCWR